MAYTEAKGTKSTCEYALTSVNISMWADSPDEDYSFGKER